MVYSASCSSTTILNYLDKWQNLTLARALRHLRRGKAAASLPARLAESCAEQGRHDRLLEIWLLQALLAF